MTTGQEHHKMLNALRMMRAEKQGQQRYTTKITARVYESIKQEYAELQSKQFAGVGNGMFGKHHTQDAKDKIRQKNLGKKLTLEQIEKLKKAITGKKKPPITEEHRAKLSVAKQGENNKMWGKTQSEDTRKKIGDKLRGRKQTEEEKLARSLANMGKKRKKLLCPHCDKLVAVNGYARWHGANCKTLNLKP
jgi:hydroxymethylpyrimidine pyrophosphatase-like HAD family hydrolase